MWEREKNRERREVVRRRERGEGKKARHQTGLIKLFCVCVPATQRSTTTNQLFMRGVVSFDWEKKWEGNNLKVQQENGALIELWRQCKKMLAHCEMTCWHLAFERNTEKMYFCELRFEPNLVVFEMFWGEN